MLAVGVPSGQRLHTSVDPDGWPRQWQPAASSQQPAASRRSGWREPEVSGLATVVAWLSTRPALTVPGRRVQPGPASGVPHRPMPAAVRRTMPCVRRPPVARCCAPHDVLRSDAARCPQSERPRAVPTLGSVRGVARPVSARRCLAPGASRWVRAASRARTGRPCVVRSPEWGCVGARRLGHLVSGGSRPSVGLPVSGGSRRSVGLPVWGLKVMCQPSGEVVPAAGPVWVGSTLGWW